MLKGIILAACVTYNTISGPQTFCNGALQNPVWPSPAQGFPGVAPPKPLELKPLTPLGAKNCQQMLVNNSWQWVCY